MDKDQESYDFTCDNCKRGLHIGDECCKDEGTILCVDCADDGSRGMTQYRRLEIYTGHGVKPDDLVDRLRKRSKSGLGSYANMRFAAYLELDNNGS